MGQENRSQFDFIVPGQTHVTLLSDGQRYKVHAFDGHTMVLVNSSNLALRKTVEAAKGGFVVDKNF